MSKPKTGRKPVKNFIIKKSLQMRIVLQIFFLMVLTGVLTSVLVALYYNYKSGAGTFYYMSNNIRQDLELASILSVVLPSLIVAQLVSYLIALGIGLLSSRKVAVPVYKMEKWTAELAKGNLGYRMFFREGDQLQELARRCNDAADYYRDIFLSLKSSVETIDTEAVNEAAGRAHIVRIREILGKVALE